jgi:predicted DNA-binding transcriptional regulator YafY
VPGGSKSTNRGRSIIRQWRVLRAIEATRQGVTIEELHEQLGRPCTVRTLYRDVEQLQQAGFSLVSTDGRWTVVRVNGDAVSCPVRPSEVVALRLALQLLEPMGEGPAVTSLRELAERIAARLTPEGRAYAAEISAMAVARHLLASAPVPADVEATVHEGLKLGQCLRIRHAAPGKAAHARVVEPRGIWVQGGRSYLVGHCRETNEVRSFLLGRIEAAEVIEDTFEADPSFDLAAYARRSFGVFQGPSHRYAIDLHPEVAHVARERIFHPSQRATAGEGGWTRLTFESAGLPEVAAWVAGYGGYAVAIGPPELVEAVRALHETGLAALEEGRDAL